MKDKSNMLKDIFLMLSFIWKGDKTIFILKMINIIFVAFQTTIGTLYIKWILDSIQNGTFRESLLLILKVQTVSFAIYTIITVVGRVVLPRAEYRLRNFLQNVFVTKAMEHDLECYENVEYYDNFTKAARVADGKALDFLNYTFDTVQQMVVLMTFLGVIISLDPVLLGFIVVLIGISMFDTNVSNKLSHEEYEAEQSITRRSEYIKKVAHHKWFAKDVRIYQMGDFLISKLNKTFGEKYELYKKYNGKYWLLKYFVSFTNTILVTPLLMVYLVYCVYSNSITIGSFSALFTLCFSVSSNVTAIFNNISNVNFESRFYVSHLRKVLDYKPKIEDGMSHCGKHISAIHSIEFINVFFAYPYHEKNVLKDISFKIEENQKIAIVGKNGAGKSTIIKILLRLYDVDSGEVLINGIPIKEYDIRELRKCFSCTMQDYIIYDFTIAENLSLSMDYDRAMCDEALAFSGLSECFDKTQNYYDCYVGREFDEKGIQLSGGEKQRLAISRAYYNKGSVLILDEANSALDPLAEYNLNLKIINSLGNQMVIFVSHRLSTTINADKIIVLDNGEMIDIGTHAELQDSCNLYKEMFHCQARAYRCKLEIEEYE